MFCINCGNKIPDNAKFCGGCGSAVVATNQQPPQYTQPQQYVQQPQPQPQQPQQYSQQPTYIPTMEQQRYAQTQNTASKPPKKRKSKLGIVFVLLLLIAVGVLGYMFVPKLLGESGDEIPTFEGSAKEIMQQYADYLANDINSYSMSGVADGSPFKWQVDKENMVISGLDDKSYYFAYKNEYGDCLTYIKKEDKWSDAERISAEEFDYTINNILNIVELAVEYAEWEEDGKNQFVADEAIFKVSGKEIRLFEQGDNPKNDFKIYAINNTKIAPPSELDIDDMAESKDKDNDENNEKLSGDSVASAEIVMLVDNLKNMTNYTLRHEGNNGLTSIYYIDTDNGAAGVSRNGDYYRNFEENGGKYDEYVNALNELVIDELDQLDADNWIKENGVYINTTDDYEYRIEIKDNEIYIFDNIKIKDINTTVVN